MLIPSCPLSASLTRSSVLIETSTIRTLPILTLSRSKGGLTMQEQEAYHAHIRECRLCCPPGEIRLCSKGARLFLAAALAYVPPVKER